MAIDPNIKKKANDIRNKVYGKEVRESLASGLEAMSSNVVENEGRQSIVESRQDSVESQWQAVSDEMTDKDVISAPEIIAARNGEANLKARLDKEKNEVAAQLAHKANKNINDWFHSLDKRKRHFAHRGASRIAPENTIPAFEKAGQLGFWGYETDLIVTSDGEFMLMHDTTVDRTTNGTGLATDFTYDQMKELNIDGGYNVVAYPNTKVPDLREFLTVCVKYNAVPNLHIKNLTDSQTEKLVSILDEFGLSHKCVITTYDETALDRFYNIDPKVVVGIIYGNILQEKIDHLKKFPNAFYYAEKQFLTADKVKLVKSSGLKLCVATIYQTDYMNYPLRDVDFLVTDNILEGVI